MGGCRFIVLTLAVILNSLYFCDARTTDVEEFQPHIDNIVTKRYYGSSCKGIYDRKVFDLLERVCQACYNLYRKPHVATECRRDCFTSEVFEGCLRDLMMEDFLTEYTQMAHLLAGRK